MLLIQADFETEEPCLKVNFYIAWMDRGVKHAAQRCTVYVIGAVNFCLDVLLVPDPSVNGTD